MPNNVLTNSLRRSRIAMVLAATMLVVGCSRGGPSASPTPQSLKLLRLRATATLEGALVGQTKFTSTRLSARSPTCAALAREGTRSDSFQLPTPPTVGNGHLQWIATLNPYTGPGRYGVTKMPGLRVTIGGASANLAKRYLKSAGTSADATIESNGSGRFEFRDLTNTEDQKLSGKIRWTCEP